jgi:hypothetical protein
MTTIAVWVKAVDDERIIKKWQEACNRVRTELIHYMQPAPIVQANEKTAQADRRCLGFFGREETPEE